VGILGEMQVGSLGWRALREEVAVPGDPFHRVVVEQRGRHGQEERVSDEESEPHPLILAPVVRRSAVIARPTQEAVAISPYHGGPVRYGRPGDWCEKALFMQPWCRNAA